MAVELLDGEDVLWKGRPSWRSMVSFYVKWFIIALIPGVVSQVLETTGVIDDARTSYFWPLTIILLLLTVLIGWLRRIDTQYVVTNKRIHIRSGILSRRDHSTQHARIQNVNTDQSIIDRMLNVGDVDFDTAGRTTSTSASTGSTTPTSWFA